MRPIIVAGIALLGFLVIVVPGRAQTKDSEIGGKSLNQWVKDLEDRDPSVRVTAMQTIVQYGEGARRAIPILLGPRGLGDLNDASIRANAAVAVGLIGLNDNELGTGVAALSNLLKDTQGITRYQATMALGRLGVKARSTPTLTHLCTVTIKDRTSWEIRKAAAFAIGSLAKNTPNGPDLHVLQALTDALNDPAVQVRIEAISALSEVGAPTQPKQINELKGRLTNALYDKEPRIRLYGRLLLMQLDPSFINDVNIAAVAKELTNPLLEARAHAARALGILGPRAQAQIPALIKVIADKESAVAGTAIAALGQMKDVVTEKQIVEIGKYLKSPEAHTRFHAVQALATFGPKSKSQVPGLIEALSDKDSAVVAAAALALAEMGNAAAPAMPQLQALTKHKDEMVRSSAEKAYTRLELTIKGVPMKLPAGK